MWVCIFFLSGLFNETGLVFKRKPDTLRLLLNQKPQTYTHTLELVVREREKCYEQMDLFVTHKYVNDAEESKRNKNKIWNLNHREKRGMNKT